MRGSVVVPAHDEARVIGRCLASLTNGTEVRVVVAANGCSDSTAEIARAHGAVVVEIDEASKVAALNQGDSAAGEVMPRIYLDADMELAPGSLDALIDALGATAQPLVAMPRLRFSLEGCSWIVRAFFKIYQMMPYLSDGLVGAGCYAVNRAGRERWEMFPQLIADDLFVQGLFAPHERVVIAGGGCIARAPRTLEGLLNVRTRSYLGNRQAAALDLAGEMTNSTQRSAKAFVKLLLSHPHLLVHGGLYAGINLIARRRASRLSHDSQWLRDATTR